jgi:hypothetical protein
VVLSDSQHGIHGSAWANLVLNHLKVRTPVGHYATGIIRVSARHQSTIVSSPVFDSFQSKNHFYRAVVIKFAF